MSLMIWLRLLFGGTHKPLFGCHKDGNNLTVPRYVHIIAPLNPAQDF